MEIGERVKVMKPRKQGLGKRGKEESEYRRGVIIGKYERYYLLEIREGKGVYREAFFKREVEREEEREKEV